MTDDIILVDDKDNQIGTGEKMAVHKAGKLHRAFSIFVFNSQRELMLQKRASGKYHCGGLWTNTCCSHPRPNENLIEATKRRLQEEMGFGCDLEEVLSFIYKVKFDNGLVEHEFDHVLVGKFDSEPEINPDEVEDWRWIKMEDLFKDIKLNPDNYTPWFRILMEDHRLQITNLYKFTNIII